MKTYKLLLIPALFSVIGTHAQITSIGGLSLAYPVHSLVQAGPKIMTYSATGFTLFNLDLTVYQNITFPPLPPGREYSAAPCYITTNLFDTDTSSIEYLVRTNSDTTSGPYGTTVARTDGTVLLQENDLRLQQTDNGYTDLDPNWIFNTPDGAIMVLLGVPDSTHVYLLPGQLPCIPCSEPSLVLGGGDQQGVGSSPALMTFPNPAESETIVRYELPAGVTQGVLVLTDTQGNEVKRQSVIGAGELHLSTAQLAAGTYLYHIETTQGIVGAKRMVVVH